MLLLELLLMCYDVLYEKLLSYYSFVMVCNDCTV